MTAMPPKSGFATDEHADPHVWRSKIIEKCAVAERAVAALLWRRGIKNLDRAPFSQKINRLAKELGEGHSAGKAEGRLAQVIAELRPLAELRSELAHSTIAVGAIDNQHFLVFRNAAEQHPEIDRRVVVNVAEMGEISRRMNDIANRLKQAAS